MSVLLEFSMFPTDKGESVSKYVSRILEMIDTSGVEYQLTPMGTVIECEKIDDALDIIKRSYECLEKDCSRVYSSLKFDIRKDKKKRLTTKIDSIEKTLGKKIKH
ncbi:MTH1187 family thiamine-binding protein [Sulfurospirillum arcachonense]|uniref:MTH1187 family thiamine-binding protein n=1 Tax=Sulfurospirillum arcachonense TaxID=57666 RepID=UPI00046A2516|nr:MTH1187 family thiamine-binding protein [Sulfurospirillum arcachonense]